MKLAGWTAAWVWVLCVAGAAAWGQEVDAFKAPPAEARPMTWWHWMQGNVSREGITADLEAMKRAGLSGAMLFHVGQLPIEGDVKFMSQKWWELMRFATDEAARLGLSLGFHNCPGWSASGGPWIKVEQSMQRLVFSSAEVTGPGEVVTRLQQPKTNRNYYRDIALLAYPTGDEVAAEQVLDITAKMEVDGTLRWSAPAGRWNVVRVGHTTTGQGNAPAPPGGWGLECDKMSREAFAAHYEAYPAKVIANAGEHAGKTLKTVTIDSYEAGEQNWTPLMREEFLRRRGYDLLPWLVTLNGQRVGSPELTERFAYDLKQTIAELYAENYYSAAREMIHQTPGMQFAVEPYGGPFSTAQTGATGDLVMGEFWQAGWYHVQPIASVAHVNGKRIVATESFTGQPQGSQWRQGPYELKATGDRAFALGVNMHVLHTWAHQPWVNVRPGMTMGWWGTHFSGTQTWWGQAGGWVDYLARCQYMLQQGLFVADVLQLEHEQQIPGYRADTCGEADLQRLEVKAGRLVLPDGMSYAVLDLGDRKAVTPEVLKEVKRLADRGARIFGRRPERSPSLSGYPQCDAEVKTLSEELWGGRKVRSGWLGPDALREAGLAADVILPQGVASGTLVWIHRRTDTRDIYFFSNQSEMPLTANVSLRAKAGRVELWHADSGRVEPAPQWRTTDERTEVQLHLDPSGSLFVVLGGEAGGIDPAIELVRDGEPVRARASLAEGFELHRATYGILADESKQRDVTAQIRQALADGRVVRADNTLAGDPASMVVKQLRVEYSI